MDKDALRGLPLNEAKVDAGLPAVIAEIESIAIERRTARFIRRKSQNPTAGAACLSVLTDRDYFRATKTS